MPAAAKADSAEAPERLITVHGFGTWQDAEGEAEWSTQKAWVDARVANWRFDKRVFVEVDVPYEEGSRMRVLYDAGYRGALGDDERWGTDAIEIHVDGGPDAAVLSGPVGARLRVQADLNGDGVDEVRVTPWFTLFGVGDYVPASDDPWGPGLSSPVEPGAERAEVVAFAPFEDPGAIVLEEIEAARQSIHAAIFNLSDPEIVEALVRAHQRGVQVRLITDASKLDPRADYLRGDDRLLRAGVPLLGVARPGHGAMHDKIGLFDGRVLTTGSANWQTGARLENHENLLRTERPELIEAYASRFVALAGGPRIRRQIDESAEAWVRFGPDEAPAEAVARLIDSASHSLQVAMFTAKAYEAEGPDLFEHLARAAERGVEVTLITDLGIAEPAEYFGRISGDDQTDERLQARGVKVVLADNTFGPYASMHHKYFIVDGHTLGTGALNWYFDALFVNDEDLLVRRDPALVQRYTDEFVHLLHRYDADFDPAAQPAVEQRFEVQGDTQWGESLVLVGDLPELGEWDPSEGLALDPEDHPRWRARLELPRGARFAYKLVRRDARGALHWESGEDRQAQAGRGPIEAIFRP